MALATVITGLFLWLPFRFLDRYIFNTAKTVELVGLSVVTGLIGILVYGLLSYLLKIKELDQFVGLFKKLRRFYEQPVTYP